VVNAQVPLRFYVREIAQPTLGFALDKRLEA
jgi:hypothetical protein